mmetsp:Transcript_90092/g.239375  ORF Transcript_90092/g.239375 Transcript_90092/m.239375 type:complete len:382 (+) Transcript_90092:503-1648(+)
MHLLEPLPHHVQRGLDLHLRVSAGPQALVELPEALHHQGAVDRLALVGAELQEEAVRDASVDAVQEHHAGEVQRPQDHRSIVHALGPGGVLQVPQLLLQHAPQKLRRQRPQALLRRAELVEQLHQWCAAVATAVVAEVGAHGVHQGLGQRDGVALYALPHALLQRAAEGAEVLPAALQEALRQHLRGLGGRPTRCARCMGHLVRDNLLHCRCSNHCRPTGNFAKKRGLRARLVRSGRAAGGLQRRSRRSLARRNPPPPGRLHANRARRPIRSTARNLADFPRLPLRDGGRLLRRGHGRQLRRRSADDGLRTLRHGAHDPLEGGRVDVLAQGGKDLNGCSADVCVLVVDHLHNDYEVLLGPRQRRCNLAVQRITQQPHRASR